MFNKNYLLTICFFFFLFNCTEEVKTSFSDVTISTKNNNLVEVNIPKASGNAAIINPINSEINKVVITALHIGNPDSIPSNSIEESITSFNNEYEAFKTNFPESSQIWEAQIDGEILYKSSKIMSIAITSYINTGGAHGNLNISFLNFNSESGVLIPNEALFNDVDAFKKIAKTNFDEEIKDEEILFDSENFELPANIGYTEEGIVLLYNSNEIGSYSTGIIEFIIPFEKVSSLLVFNGSY